MTEIYSFLKEAMESYSELFELLKPRNFSQLNL